MDLEEERDKNALGRDCKSVKFGLRTCLIFEFIVGEIALECTYI